MSNTQSINPDELKQWLDEKRDFFLIDVVPQVYFAEEHLPGARCACVYEVSFLDQVRAIIEDKGTTIVVYGSSSNSKASSEAARKLTDAGYNHVRDFVGGIAEWKRAGFPIEGSKTPLQRQPQPQLQDRMYRLDTTQSGIEWVGRNLANKHTGTLRFLSGEIAIKRGEIDGGQFVIDMRSIGNTDLADVAHKQLLIQHLRSDDFFDVARFPEARFVITAVNPIEGCTPGLENCVIHGTLQMKGVEHPLSFPTLTGATSEGEFVAQAHLDFDRTLWHVLYGSGKHFEKLGMHLVNDLVSIQLKLVAR